MKGIAHFATGVAIATFFPEVVHSAAAGSVLPVLGGIAGVLPDTLDFKFVRYFEAYDVEIDPGPEPDGQGIAAELLAAMHSAYHTGEPKTVMLHTIRLGPDVWRRYALHFRPRSGEIGVRIGPVVDTGRHPLPGSAAEGVDEVRLGVDVPMAEVEDEDIEIDVFSGPSLTFERRDDLLQVRFLDWHRRWTHSLPFAAGLGMAVTAIAALVEHVFRGGVSRMPAWAGLVVALGLLGHILGDQLGHMGSNLLYPFTRRRTAGLGLFRSGDPTPNFLTVWVSMMATLFNLDRFSSQPQLDQWWFLGLATAVPLLVIGVGYQRRRWSTATGPATGSLRQEDVLSEVEEVETY